MAGIVPQDGMAWQGKEVFVVPRLKLPAASYGESSKCKEVKEHSFHFARLPRSKLRGMRSQCTFRI